MTDSKVNVNPAAADQGNGVVEPVNAFQAITSQEDLDRIIQTRLARQEAKYADYNTLKEKAGKFDQAEAEKLSEIEKASQRAEQAEKLVAEMQLDKLRRDVADAKGIPAKLVTGTTQEEMEAAADALISWRGVVPDQVPNSSPGPRPNPQQGTPSQTNKPSGIAAGEEAARRRGWIQ
ncbi:hypothetical protein [Nocardia brasiliensis]|uniref:hypothetical protein n=1 Tax=Nocardia brasiliensis TaxID=37326 RepID=UPI002456CADC|nr:hypothetical protein [Nocardia brasiliensis]